MWVIQIGDAFVKDFSNTLAQAVTCTRAGAKRFDTQPEAKKWASAYLTAYRWVIVPFVP